MIADHPFERLRGSKACARCGRPSGQHPSALGVEFDRQVELAGLGSALGMKREFYFAARVGRGWCADRAWKRFRVLVELDGGTKMARGMHTTRLDRDRDNFAQLDGWIVLRFEERHLRLGLAVRQLAAALKIRADRKARAALGPEMFPPPSAVKAALKRRARRLPLADFASIEAQHD